MAQLGIVFEKVWLGSGGVWVNDEEEKDGVECNIRSLIHVNGASLKSLSLACDKMWAGVYFSLKPVINQL